MCISVCMLIEVKHRFESFENKKEAKIFIHLLFFLLIDVHTNDYAIVISIFEHNEKRCQSCMTWSFQK